MNPQAMSKNTGDGELDKIIEDLWSAAVLDTVNTIQKTKPKNSTYVSDNIWYAKQSIQKYTAQEANKAKQQLLQELMEHCREYEITDLEMLDHHNETPLVAVPISVIQNKLEGLS